MKNSTLIAISFLLFSISGFAQNNVQFKINHKLGTTNFAMETGAKNNLNNDFEVTRLEYYISEITITHDGGAETTINDLWILVDAEQATQVDLGNHNISSVEKISFFTGVDPDHNHADPSTYPASHPLAPQSPSMHWGWAAGYRFVAFEGNGSSAFNQLIQLHGLEDDNYFQTEVAVNVVAENNEVIISLDADYTRALEDIGVNGGIIVHGGYGAAKKCLENFRDFVFSAASESTSTIDFSEVSKFEVFPNPTNGNATVTLKATQDLNYDISVTDVLGKQVLFFNEVSSNSTIDLTVVNAGFYFINLIKEGQPVIMKKLIVD
jgi:Secretion system C-terminal sorting domain